MAKVAVLTLHRPYLNLGSALQAYALCRVLVRLGHSVELVDYSRPALSGWNLARWRLGPPGASIAKRLANLIGLSVEAAIAGRRIGRFVRTRTPLSPRRFPSHRSLLAAPPQAQVYVTGSDQVWNSVYNGGVDRALYLDFGPEQVIRIAYAASFGLSCLPADELAATAKLVARLKYVSMRDDSGIQIIESLGLSACKVLDPTLLLSPEDWGSFTEKPRLSQPYLLLYCVEDDQLSRTVCIARRIADHTGMPVYQVTMGGCRRHTLGIDRTFFFSDPIDFVRMFASAAFVVTASMHGTAFALNFRKDFLSVAPSRFAGRAESLLRSFGLLHRYIAPDACEWQRLPQIDHERAQKILSHQRSRSIAFLQESIPS